MKKEYVNLVESVNSRRKYQFDLESDSLDYNPAYEKGKVYATSEENSVEGKEIKVLANLLIKNGVSLIDANKQAITIDTFDKARTLVCNTFFSQEDGVELNIELSPDYGFGVNVDYDTGNPEDGEFGFRSVRELGFMFDKIQIDVSDDELSQLEQFVDLLMTSNKNIERIDAQIEDELGAEFVEPDDYSDYEYDGRFD
jgi:hypothetical protein